MKRLLKIKAAVGTADENAVLEAEFPNLESQSVDYGIMEKRRFYLHTSRQLRLG